MASLPKLKVGLLPFYLKLYDELLPETRDAFGDFLTDVASALEARGLALQTAPICRVEREFAEAIEQFEQDGVQCIITLHLAYSPSLESIDPICGTDLPVIILDTTMDAKFGTSVSPDRIMYNHGVHGVMDFASMLRRRRRPFEIVAGHHGDGGTIDRAARIIRAVVAAADFRGSRVLRVGDAFAGMGDFDVAEDVLSGQLGIRVTQIDLDTLDAAIETVTDAAVTDEVASDQQRFNCELTSEVHERSVRVGLGLRHLLEEGGYSALSVNFQAFDRADRPASTMPFLEISKAMARGVGYAGEGDVLTAALVGALARTFDAATFTEIFCPDWAGETLFLSHMGEISPSIAAEQPRVFSKPLFSGGSADPAVLTCAAKAGPAVFVNLTPGPDDTFSLILAPVEVLGENGSCNPEMRDLIRTWIRPYRPVADFLETYSRAGGTHHSALVLGNHIEPLAAFGRACGFKVVRMM